MNYKTSFSIALGVVALTLVTAVSKSVLPVYAVPNLSEQKILLAQSRSFPLKGSKLTELGDHRRMETSVTISNNGRIDGVTRTWTADRKSVV
jgi:hypothetical protein